MLIMWEAAGGLEHPVVVVRVTMFRLTPRMACGGAIRGCRCVGWVSLGKHHGTSPSRMFLSPRNPATMIADWCEGDSFRQFSSECRVQYQGQPPWPGTLVANPHVSDIRQAQAGRRLFAQLIIQPQIKDGMRGDLGAAP